MPFNKSMSMILCHNSDVSTILGIFEHDTTMLLLFCGISSEKYSDSLQMLCTFITLCDFVTTFLV